MSVFGHRRLSGPPPKVTPLSTAAQRLRARYLHIMKATGTFAMNDGWHIDKRLSVSHLVTTAMMLGGLLWWAAGMEGRMSLLERDLQVVDNRIDREMTRNAADLERISVQLNRIEDRIERLAERNR